MNHLIVAFASEAMCRRVSDALAAFSLPVRAVCRTGAEVLRAVEFMGGGAVLCGAKLPDRTADQLYEDLEGQAEMLALAKPEYWELCGNPHIFRVALPINASELASAVQALIQREEQRQPGKANAADQAFVRQAKAQLQRQLGLSEPEAHRYLQKQSMALRRPMARIAEEMLRKNQDS